MKNGVPSTRPSGVIGSCAALALLSLLLAITPVVSGQIVATAPNTGALERFEEGIELVAQDKAGEAMRIFEELTRSYPDWPEPHNNLAVLYAARGEEKKAEQALLAALNAHPSYSLVYQNLRTLYADMAGRAYRKALQSDAGESAAPRLALAENLVAPVTQSPDTSAITVAAMRAPRLAPEPVAEPAAPEPIVKAEPVAVAAVPEPMEKAGLLTAPAVPESVPGPEPGIDMARGILDTIDSWAAAWAAQDVARYLSFYGHHFVPENDMPRSRWETVRRIRVTTPDYIEVHISEPRVDLQDGRTATVRFLQVYRSNTFVGRTTKTLHVFREPDGWKIIRERVGG
jgi:ketosteroid isomerase-like protein